MADRTIRVTVVGDSKSLQSALKQSEASLRSLDSSAAKSQQSLSTLETGFKGAALVAGALAAAKAFGDLLDSASRLQTAQAANQRIWGQHAASMQQAADAAADYGLSQADYLQTVSKLGSQLQNLGMNQDQAASSAQSLMRMGENLAAVFGTDVPSAVSAISAALRGEFDPLEQYGIGITAAAVQARMGAEGISKAQAIIAIAMDQSKSSIGAAAAAQDTFAGKQKALAASFENAKAALGEGLLPAAEGAVEAMTALAKGVTLVPQGLMQIVGTVASAAFAVKALGFAMDVAAAKTAGWAVAMRESSIATMQSMGSVGMSKVSAGISRVGQVIPGVAAVVIGLYEAYQILDDKATEAAVSQEDLTKALTGVDAGSGALAQVVAQVKQFAPALAEVQSNSTNVVGAIKNLGSTFLNWGQTSGIRSMEESVDNLKSSLIEFMAVNPAAGAAATKDAFNQLTAAGIPAEQAAALLGDALVQADAILAAFGPDVAAAAAATNQLTAAFNANKTAADSLAASFQALFTGLDVGVAVQKWQEALSGIKAAAKGGFDATEIQQYNQAWRDVATSMRQNGATTEQIAAKYDQMRGAMERALNAVGIKGQAADRILNQVFGKPRVVKTAIKADVTQAEAQAKRGKKAIDAVMQHSPAKILARWLGQGDTRRGQRDIDGVRQRRPASIDADPNPAISAAGEAANALSAVAGTYSAVISVTVSAGQLAMELIGRLWSGDNLRQMDFGEEEFPWFGVQERAKNTARQALGRLLGGQKQLNIDVVLNLAQEGDWNAAISQLTRLQRLAEQTDKEGHATAVAKAARKELQARRQLLETVQEYIKNAKVMFNGSMVGYTGLKRRLDDLRSSMASLADELTEALNGVNIGTAWSAVQSQTETNSSTIDTLTGQLDEYRKAKAEAFNPRLIDYYNDKIWETSVAIAMVNDAQSQNTLSAQLKKQLQQTADFYNRVNQLRGKISDEALAELIRTGPEQGAAIAQQLINDKALRDQYNQTFSDAARYSRQLGNEVARDLYAPQIQAVTNAIATLRKQVEAWLARRKQIKVRLDWTQWQLPAAKDLPDWVVNPKPHRVDAHQTVNVTVQGMVADPEGTARAIRRLLRDHANRTSSVEWARS